MGYTTFLSCRFYAIETSLAVEARYAAPSVLLQRHLNRDRAIEAFTDADRNRPGIQSN
ncbi:hypothetical protein CKA32_006805 [Geitlerinema sp. FC II]|nr:hypothetical protein CKA32_006805 [Geitlerinema sp. FC II]